MTEAIRRDGSGFGRGDLALLVVLGAIWGATFPVARLGVAAGANPFLLVTLDMFVAGALMALLAAGRSVGRPAGRILLESLGLGALLIGGINLTLFWGEQYVTGGAASIVYATAPFISLFSASALGASPRGRAVPVVAPLVGLAGVVALAFTSSGTGVVTDPLGLVAFALGALCQGVGATLVGRARPEGEGSWGLAFQFLGAGFVAAALLPLIGGSYALPIAPATIGSILFLAILTLASGYTIFYRLIRRVGPVRANVVTFLNPVFALVLGVVVFGESFQPYESIGLALVLVALVLLQWPSRKA